MIIITMLCICWYNQHYSRCLLQQYHSTPQVWWAL